MRRGALCAVGAARQDQHLPLPDVPEGVRRAIRVIRGPLHLPLLLQDTGECPASRFVHRKDLK